MIAINDDVRLGSCDVNMKEDGIVGTSIYCRKMIDFIVRNFGIFFKRLPCRASE
jgi:hypothetical protein